MRRALKAFLFLTIAAILCPMAKGQALQSARGWCENGNQQVLLAGLLSTSQVQASYPSCTVTVYLHGTLTLATIYSDNNLTPLANPFTAQTNGQWTFFAANAEYDVTNSGGGLTAPVTYSDILLVNASGGGGASCGGTDTAILFNSLGTCTGNASFLAINKSTGLLSALGGLSVPASALFSAGSNASLKYNPNYGVQFVDSTNGNNSNDGLSAGNAVRDVYTAWRNLPGGLACAFTSCGGTIYLNGNGIWGGPITGQGLQIMGPLDPAWNGGNVPSGWVEQKAVTVQCEGSGAWDANIQMPQCSMTGNDAGHYGIWLAGTEAPMSFVGLKIAQGKMGLITGLNSSGVFSNTTSGSTGLKFIGDSFGASNLAANGPGALIGPNSFEIDFDDCVFDGTPAATGGTEGRQGLVVDAQGFGTAGLIFVRHSHGNSGAIYVKDGNANVDGWTTEGQSDGIAGVFFASTVDGAANSTEVRNVAVADNTAATPALENDGFLPIVASNLSTGFGQNVKGPAVLSGAQDLEQLQVDTVSPQAQGQSGFQLGWVYGLRDDVQRQAALHPIRFANQVAGSNCGSWQATQFAGTTTFTCGITDPFGGTGAGQASSTASNAEGIQFLSGSGGFENVNLSVGEYIIAGAWTRSQTANGYQGGAFTPLSVSIQNPGFSASGSCAGDSYMGDGQWTWNRCLYEVTSIGTNPATVSFQASFSSVNTVQAFAPVINFIAPGTISNDEAFNYRNSLSPYDSSCVVGTLCTANLPVALPGGLTTTSLKVTDLTSGGTSNVCVTSAGVFSISGCPTGSAFSNGLGTGFQDATEIAAPANPSSGNDRLYLNSSTHQFSCVTSTGGNCMPSAGSLQWNSILSPSGSLSLTMGTNSTSWQYSNNSEINLTAATEASITLEPINGTLGLQNSGTIQLNGSYEATSGPTFAFDGWGFQDVVSSGVNGSSVLTFTHSGTSGPVNVAFPNSTLTLASLVNPTETQDVMCGSSGSWGPCAPGVASNAQTGPTYTVQTTDRGQIISTNNATTPFTTTVTLPDAGTCASGSLPPCTSGFAGFASNFHFDLINLGAGAATVSSPTLASPSAPSVSAGGTGGPAAATLIVYVTYQNPQGETLVSASTTQATTTGQVITVTAPASSGNAQGYNVYVTGGSAGTETKQNTSGPIAFGTNWTEPTTGLIAGAAAPSSNTTNSMFILGGTQQTSVTIPQNGWCAFAGGDNIDYVALCSNGQLVPGANVTFTPNANGTTTVAATGGGGSSFPETVSGTVISGGIPYFSTTTQMSSSALLPTGDFVLGGGAGGAPTATFSVVPLANGGFGTSSITALQGTDTSVPTSGTFSGANSLMCQDANSGVASCGTSITVPSGSTWTLAGTNTWNGPSSSSFVWNSSGGFTFNPANGQNFGVSLGGSASVVFTGGAGTANVFSAKAGTTSATGNCLQALNSSSVAGFAVKCPSTAQAAVIGTYASTSTAGIGMVPVYGISSLTAQTAAITTTTLFTPAAAGEYTLDAYVDSTVTCTTPGPAVVGVTYTFTDETGAKSAQTLPLDVNGATSLTSTMALGNTTNNATGHAAFWSTATAIQFATTYTACTTGTGTYAIRLSLRQIQ